MKKCYEITDGQVKEVTSLEMQPADRYTVLAVINTVYGMISVCYLSNLYNRFAAKDETAYKYFHKLVCRFPYVVCKYPYAIVGITFNNKVIVDCNKLPTGNPLEMSKILKNVRENQDLIILAHMDSKGEQSHTGVAYGSDKHFFLCDCETEDTYLVNKDYVLMPIFIV